MGKRNRRKPTPERPTEGPKPGRDDRAVVSVPALPVGSRTFARGRPSTYDPKYCDLLVAHMAMGFSFESFGADVEGIASRATLYRWVEEHEDFRDAKEKGDAACRKFWELQGVTGLHMKGFNATVWIFNMKNRFKWTDKHELSGPDGGPIRHSTDVPLSEEEVARLAELEAKAKELEAG